MAAIRAVFFDVGWTLAYPHASLWQIFAELCAATGMPASPEACEQLIRGLSRAGQQNAEQQFHAGAQYSDSDAEIIGLFVQMGRLVFSQMGITDGHDELMQRFMQAFWTEDNWDVFPDVKDVLAGLRARGVRLGVLSNAPSNLPSFLDRFGIAPYLDFTVVSAVEGVRKPDRRIFEAALSRAGVSPPEALHIGDMYLEDIVGARAVGLNTLLIERGQHSLFPNFRESQGRSIEARHVVSDLSQILERVG